MQNLIVNVLPVFMRNGFFMNVTFINPGIDYMIGSIMETQTDNDTGVWSDPLYHFYPQLNKNQAKKLSFAERKKYIENVMREIYIDQELVINNKITDYKRHWGKHKEQIENALSEAFEAECKSLFNDLRCYISINPIEPRFLKEQYFEVFYFGSIINVGVCETVSSQPHLFSL